VPKQIWAAFEATYFPADAAVQLLDYRTLPEAHASERRHIVARVLWRGHERTVEGSGNGPIDALCDALRNALDIDVNVIDYHEHAVSGGSSAQAAAYVQVRSGDGETLHGVGLHASITTASLRAVASAAARLAG
jgi:2-isopropylmalate synthase